MAGLTACSLTKQSTQTIIITIHVDGEEKTVQAVPGTNIFQTLNQAGISIESLDRIDPPGYTSVSENLTIKIYRVTEKFEISQVVIPYQQQTITNESLPSGDTRLIQPGENGLNEITTRLVLEDGIQNSRHQVKTEVIKEAIPEIMMVGVQVPFTTITIPGRLVYLTAGSGWVMDGSTGIRRPIVSTGDLDGRVFNLSNDGNWLLFTRKSTAADSDDINSLWIAYVGSTSPSMIDLNVRNVIHFADFVPGMSQTIAYSTVEPRQEAPGWQANNDLRLLTYNPEGEVALAQVLIESGTGGIYGWWGTSFLWSPDGTQILYSRPDGIGLVDPIDGNLQPQFEITPFQSNSSWAWIPGVAWDQSGQVVYFTNHPDTTGITMAEDSPQFNLMAVNLHAASPVQLSDQSGMFAYPAVSPLLDGGGVKLAYLQAIFPDRSDSSSYRLLVADQDGSNRELLFPRAGSSGLDPQHIVWSPEPLGNGNLAIGLVYQGNIWLVNAIDGTSQQITGDGLTSRIDWH